MSENKKFLHEGTDYMDAALDFDKEKNKVHEKYIAKQVSNRTLNELMNLPDLSNNAIEIGTYLSSTYSQEKFDSLLDGLKIGFERAKEVDNFEEEETKRLNKLFETFGDK